jgi:hypothetical protein
VVQHSWDALHVRPGPRGALLPGRPEFHQLALVALGDGAHDADHRSVIFRKAQNKIQEPAKLRRLIVDLIDKPGPGPGDTWSSLSADVKGDAYEGLLQKNAEDVKGGAGQYFTPRPLIAAMVDAVTPRPGQTMCDPAGGTGGFVLATHDYLASHYALDRAQKKLLKSGTLFVVELVEVSNSKLNNNALDSTTVLSMGGAIYSFGCYSRLTACRGPD